jgi:hypothetical protein
VGTLDGAKMMEKQAGSGGSGEVVPSENPPPTLATRRWGTTQPHSRKRVALAFLVAAVSDLFSFWLEMLPPVQWAIDLGTAALLFLILGRRWAILPGLVAEAIPGLAMLPWWVLVVLSIVLYDDIKGRRK